MRYKLCLLILSLFIGLSVVAQEVKINVKLGNEPAEYAFIFKNGCCLGNCDSLGRFDFRTCEIEGGDSLKASVAGFSSEVVVYDGKAEAVILNVRTEDLAGAKVVEKNVRRVDEYVSLVRCVPFEWRVFARRFHCEYEIGDDTKSLGQVADFTVLDNSGRRFSKGKGDVLIYSFGNNSDYRKVGYDVYRSYVILGKILNRHSERLKDECTSGRMMVHKLSDDAGISYILIDKSGENSQILVRFGERKELLDVCLEGNRNERYGLEHYVWKISILTNRKGPVRISGIELRGRAISTGEPIDVVIKELYDAPLVKADWTEIRMNTPSRSDFVYGCIVHNYAHDKVCFREFVR